MLTEILLLVLLQQSSGISNSPNPNCSYFQELGSGESYSVYNPHFPREYEGENYCQWITITNDRFLDVNCSLTLPESSECNEDSLIIQDQDDVPRTYCGRVSLIFKVYNRVAITLITSDNSTGGTFECDIKTPPDEDALGDERDKCHCGWKNPAKIVGGNETGVNEYPMMAGLVDLFDSEIYCGATIINNRQVVTAASCLQYKDPNFLRVVVGTHETKLSQQNPAATIFSVKSINIHPYYSGVYHDIAVLTISGLIEFSKSVGPVCLPFEHAPDSFAGQFVNILGWGNLEYTAERATTLQKIEVNVVTNNECRQIWNVQNFQMCTFAGGKDACQFDNGGPVLWRNHVTKRLVFAGIVIDSTGCALDDKPAVNTRIGAYIDWILSVTPSDITYCSEE